MIDLVFLKFVRKCLLSLFFIIVCAFDFYGMNDKSNLENGPLLEEKNIDVLDIERMREEKFEYHLGDDQSDMRPKLNQIELKRMNYNINEQVYYPKYYNFQINKKRNDRRNMLLPIQNNSTYPGNPQEWSYSINKGTYAFMTQYYFYGKKDTDNEENTTLILQDEKTKRISEFLNNPTYSERINKYPFANTLSNDKDLVQLWDNDFQDTCKNLFPEEDTDEFKTFLKFHFCHKIIKKEGISKYGPFLSDNAEKFKDFLEEVPLLRQKVSLVRRFGLYDLLEFNEEEVSWSKIDINIDKAINAYIKGTICLFNSPINEKVLEEKRYMFLYKMFVLQNKNSLNKLFVSDLLSETTECFIFSIVKYRTLLFRFIPTFIYNIFDLGRFLKDSYTYSNDGRYSLSFYNVPLILGKTSPLFFNIFQVDFFFNFPLGIFLSCLDFCAYSILRGNLTHKEKDKFPLFQRIFLVWRPFVSDDVDISFISEKSEKEKFEKEECYSAFASVVLKVLTNFVGVNFNIKVKGNYFFSINLMSFVDDFILREYFLDSFNYSSKNLRPSSWSIFYETNNKERSKKG